MDANSLKMRWMFLVIVLVTGCSTIHVQAQHADVVRVNDTLSLRPVKLYKDNFTKGMSQWNVEQMPGGTVIVKDGAMEIEDVSGCTIWFIKKLQAPVMITYDVVVIKADGAHDRVSDLNCFWLATDPHHPDAFLRKDSGRNGKFGTYDSLKLYYVGLGGHNNSKTRFRRYDGEGNKPLLPEHDLSSPEHLITPNKTDHIKIIVYENLVQYYRNEIRVFNLVDPSPLTEGYFGIRTVDNHMTVDNFNVYSLKRNSK